MNGKHIFATGLDAGSSFTRCVIALLEDGRLRVMGFGSVPSEGWSKSRISNQQPDGRTTNASLKARFVGRHRAVVRLCSACVNRA